MGNFLATSIPSTPTATQNFQLTIVDEYNFIDSRKSYTLVLNGISFTDYTITEPSQIVFNNVFSRSFGNISYSIREGTDTVYSSTITIAQPTAPSAPTGVTAVGGNAQATVTLTPPTNNGGSKITSYTVTSTPATTTSTISIDVNRNGLLAYYDPRDTSSYSGTGSTLTSLVGSANATLSGNYSLLSNGIRLKNTSSDLNANISFLQLPSLTNITTVSIWYYHHGNNGLTSKYLLDGRTGGSGGYIYSGGAGTNWDTGTMYVNGGAAQTISSDIILTVEGWKNVTVIADTQFTDDLTIFGRFSQNEGMDVTFGPILIYNRVLSQSENASNYRAFAQQYGLSSTFSTTMPSLVNGLSYSFNVTATNAYGTSSAGTSSSITLTPPTFTTSVSSYGPNQAITVSFANGPGNPKDWIGLYPEGNTPMNNPSTLWLYVDGTQNGTVGVSTGSVTFSGGLPNVGSYRAYFLLNDGYTILNSTTFTIGIGQVGTVTATPGNALVDLSWNPVSGAIGYLVERSTNGSSWSVDISSNPTTSYRSSGLTNGTLYYYRVSARSANSLGTASATVTATPNTTAPSAPTNVTAQAGSGQAYVSWTASNANGSPISYYTVTATPGNISVNTGNGSTTNLIVPGLTNGISYTFSVTATNAVGTSSATTQSNSLSTVSWTLRASPADRSWVSIAYGVNNNNQPMWVAVATTATGTTNTLGTNRLMTSYDGVEWVQRSPAADVNWNAVAYGQDGSGNPLWVAVASGGTLNRIMTSSDGITWTSRNNLQDNSWRGVEFGYDGSGNRVWCAVSSGGTNKLIKSSDGYNWSLGTVPNVSWYSIKYAANTWVIVGATGQFAFSTDTTNWTLRNTSVSAQLNSVDYGNGRWIAVGQTNSITTSTDLSNWTTPTNPLAGTIEMNEIRFGDGMWMSVGADVSRNGFLISSNNGTQWINQNVTSTKTWQTLAYANGLWVALASMDVSGTSGNRIMTLSFKNGTYNTSTGTMSTYSVIPNYMWTAVSEGTFNVPLRITNVDSQGNIYNLLYTDAQGNIPIRNADGTTFATVTTTSAITYIFIKQNPFGQVQWYTTIQENSSSNVSGFVVDSSDNLYISSWTYATSSTFNGTSGSPITLTRGGSDFYPYIAKYNSNGVVQFAFYPVNANAGIWGLCTSGTDLYASFDSPSSTYSLLNSNGTSFRSSIAPNSTTVSWLVKYNGSGNIVWATRIFVGGVSRGTTLGADTSGNIYVGGVLRSSNTTYTINQVNGSLDQATSSTIVSTIQADSFLIKYSNAGARIWSVAITGSGNNDWPNILAVSSTGVYLPVSVNSSSLSILFNNTGSTTTITGLTTTSNAMIKFLLDGTYGYTIQIVPSGGSFADFSMVKVDSNENVYIGGIFSSSTATITDATNSTTTLTRVGAQNDAFIARFNPSGVYNSIYRLNNTGITDWWVYGPALGMDSSNNIIFNQTIRGNASSTFTVLNSDGSNASSITRTTTGYANLIGKLWPTVTNQPTNVTAVSGNGQATVSWNAPTNNGGSSVASYIVTSNPGNITAVSTTTSATVTGLTNGTSYTFTVVAINTAGSSSSSIASTAVTPSTTPDPPTNVNATRGNGQATITWTASASNGGADISGYTVTSNPPGFTASTNSSTTTATITGLTNGTSYTFDVVATNIRGNSVAGTSNSITPATTPGVPTNVTVVRGDGQATVSWTAPSDNGSAITSYTVTSSPGGFTETTVDGSSNSVTVTGLTNGSQYTFTVTATNSVGTSAASSTSSAVVPSNSSSGLVSWSALSTGINNSIDQSTFTGTVRSDISGNRYTAQIIPGYDTNMTFNNFTFNVVNSDGTVFATITPTQPTIIIIKRNVNGMVQWYTTFTSTSKLHTYAIDVDSDGNVYACGLGHAAVQFNSTNASTVTVSFPAGAGIMGYYAKWNNAGVIQHAFKPINPTSTTLPNVLFNNIRCVGSAIYLAGASSYGGNFNILNANGTTFRNISSSRDNTLIKMNPDGTVAAAFQPVGTATAGLTNVEVDSSGFIYVTGYLGTGSTTYTAQNSNGSNETNSSYSITSSTASDSFIIKYNSTFTAQWMVGITTTNAVDVLWGLTLTPTGILVGMNNQGTESVTVQRHNGSLSTLATITRPAFGSTIYSFDSNGGLSWASGTTRSSALGSAYLESFTSVPNGDIYVTGIIYRSAGVTYTSPSSITTTISRVGTASDAFVMHLNSSGQYMKHWYVKNILPTGVPSGQDGSLRQSTDIAYAGSNLLLHLSSGNGMGLPSLNNFVNKTFVIAFKVVTNSIVSRIFDFNSGTSTDSYIAFSGNQGSNNFFVTSRWFSSGSQSNLISAVTLSQNTQYIATFYIQSTTATLFIYSWNGTTLTQVYTGTITYSSGGGSQNPLNQLKCLWFGRSSFTSDVFLNGTYQKILTYDGQIPTPTTTLLPVLVSPPANTTSGSTYNFTAPTGFNPVSVLMYNNPTTSTTEVSLNGSAQYLAINNLTISEVDRTVMYDTSNNTIAEFPASGQATITGTQSLIASVIIPPEAPTNLSVVNGNGQATVSWSAPRNEGVGAITSYTVTVSPGGQTATTSSTSAIVTGLTNGTNYTFTVTATNIIGTSSGATITSTPAGTPTAPMGVFAIASNASAVLKWSAPTSNGGSAVTSYTVTSSPGNITTTTSNTYVRLTGLTNGTAYTFTVTATNAIGTGLTSAASNSITPSSTMYMFYDATHESSYPGSGSIWTSLANSFNLTLYNTTYASNGLVFNGTNAYGGIPGAFSPTFPSTPLTVICWINNGSTNEGFLVNVNRTASNIINQFVLSTQRMFDHSTSFGFSQNGFNFSIPTNTVTQYVFKRNGTNGTFYTNGTSVQTITASQNVTYGSSDLYIGSNFRDGNFYFTGSMYAIKIISAALSDSDVAAEYAAGVTPSAPFNLNGSITNGVASLSWNTPTFKGYGQSPVYKIYDASTNTVLSTISNGATSAFVSLTSNNVLYVKASNTVNSVEYSSAPAYFILTYSTPGAPLNPSASVGNQQITLSWSDPSGNGGSAISGYRIERSIDSSNWTVDVSNNATTTYTATELTNGTTYYFRISAINSNGFGSSSTVVSGSPGTAPNSPNPTIATVSTNYIDLSWDVPLNGGSPITGYLIERSLNNITWTVDVSNNVTTTYRASGLAGGVRYFFRVSARNAIGISIPSSAISGITIAQPSAPVILAGVPGYQSATIIFDQSRNILPKVTQYRYTLNGGVTYVTRPANQTLSPWFIQNLTNGVTYQFQIAAFNSNGWSPLSNMVAVTPFDNRSTAFKNTISTLNRNNITTVTTSVLTELNTVSTNEARQLIFNLAQDISAQTNEVKKATLLSTTNKISSTNNVIKSDINQQLVQLYGVTQNVPFDISDQTVVNQIIDVSSFKVPTWNPSNISIIVPNDEDDVLIANLDLSNILLTTVPDKDYTFSATYNDISSINSYTINYKRTDASRYIIYDLSNYLYLGESLSFNFPGGITRNFTFNIFGNPGGEPVTVTTGGFGDPKIFTIDNNSYYLPHDENCYLLFNNMIQNERVVITAKCWFLPDEIKNNSNFKNSMMDNKTFFRYINIHYKGENVTFDMETLKPVSYTNMNDVNNFTLKETNSLPSNMTITNIINDTLVFKNFYRNIKIKMNNVEFKGQSRIIKLGDDYEFKLSVDTNCADHRNGISVIRANYSKAIGALIKESSDHVVENLNYNEESCYLLYDNKRSERVRITAKAWYLPESVKQTSYFRNNVMENKEFIKYINVHYMGENLTIDMETLTPVKYTNMKDLTLHKLESSELVPENMNLTEIEDDQYVFKNLYRAMKIKMYNVKFDGKSRILKLGENFELKLSMDSQCSDHRNSIMFTKSIESHLINCKDIDKLTEKVDTFVL